MFRCRRLYSMLAILLLAIQQGSTLSVGELTSQHSDSTVRQVKSEEIFKYMNLSADPCENFYEYTCGNFARYNPVEAKNRPAIGIGQILNDGMEARFKRELEEDYDSDTDADRNVKLFYRSCVKIPETLSYEYPNSMKAILQEFGEMPAMAGYWWDENDIDWVETLSKMIYKTGSQIIFDISVNPDFRDNSVSRVYLSQPTKLPLGPRDFYLSDAFESVRQKYLEIIGYTLHSYLEIEDEAEVAKTSREILNFEIALAQAMIDESTVSSPVDLYELTSTDEMRRKYIHIGDIKKLVSGVFDATIDEISVQTDYVDQVMQLIDETPVDVLANYMFFSYLFKFVYKKQDTTTDVEEYCRTRTKIEFYKNIDNLMFRKYFTGESEQMLFSLWRELKTSFRDILYSPRLDWIRDDTKLEAVEKLKKMKIKVLSYDEPEVSHEVAELELNDYDYVHNMDAILSWRGQKARDKLNQPPQSVDHGVAASTTAAYNRMENVVMVPFSFLQPYFTWSNAYPSAYNFGYLGFFIGHEIVHGFDDSGRLFDAAGNYRNWWDGNTDREFRERTSCFVQQYHNLIYEGQHLPEMKVQAENIADGGGVRVAYDAYMNWYRRNARDAHGKEFPDFPNFSPDKMFFISYAHAWCSNYDASVVAKQLIDTHTPDPLRAIGPLANYEVFSQVFNCPRGTYMNPVTKCEIY